MTNLRERERERYANSKSAEEDVTVSRPSVCLSRVKQSIPGRARGKKSPFFINRKKLDEGGIAGLRGGLRRGIQSIRGF